jgi:hypothetical protein
MPLWLHVGPGHKAEVDMDVLPEAVIVPEAGRRLRCTHCGGPASVHGLIAQNLRLDEGDELLGLAANFLRM